MPAASAQNPLSEWFRRWRSPLHKFLVGRGAARVADLDDVAQEVFLRLLRYESAEVVQHPQAYIFKMAANVAAEWAIRSRHRLAHEPRWLDTLVAQDSVEEAFDNEVVQREIKRAIGTLTHRESAILKLSWHHHSQWWLERSIGGCGDLHRLSNRGRCQGSTGEAALRQCLEALELAGDVAASRLQGRGWQVIGWRDRADRTRVFPH
jgi:RNA polymerase sigma factor (sigma-70 family)